MATVLVWLLTLWLVRGALRANGLGQRLQHGLIALLCAVVGALLGALLLVLHAFHQFTGETLIAQVTCRRLARETFELTYAPRPEPRQEPALTVSLRGDQWAISGGIIKWHRWLIALGLRSYQKPLRLSGQFSRLEQQRARPPTIHPLAPDVDWYWEAFYRAAPSLPFVDAVYGSSAYVYVEPGGVYEIYVTPSGYVIKRKR